MCIVMKYEYYCNDKITLEWNLWLVELNFFNLTKNDNIINVILTPYILDLKTKILSIEKFIYWKYINLKISFKKFV